MKGKKYVYDVSEGKMVEWRPPDEIPLLELRPRANSTRYLIWSEEHCAWWAPHAAGYVRSIKDAGRYSQEETKVILAQANDYLGPLELTHEIAFPEPKEMMSGSHERTG